MIRPHMFADIVRKPLYHVLLSTDTCPRTITSPDKPPLFTILPSLAFSTLVVSFCIYLNAPLYASFTMYKRTSQTIIVQTRSNDNRLNRFGRYRYVQSYKLVKKPFKKRSLLLYP